MIQYIYDARGNAVAYIQGRFIHSMRGGLITTDMAGRIGDVVAAPAGCWAIVATQREPRESALIGMHGSLAPADQLVPMLTLPL